MVITVIFKIIILVLYINILDTSHFQGGTITYKIEDTYGSTVSIMIIQEYIYRWPLIYCDNSRILSQSTPNFTIYADYTDNLTCIANCTTAGGYQPVPVRSYCTDYSSAMAISVTQRTDIVNLTIGAYFTVAFVAAAWRLLTLPTGGSGTQGWSIACTIDLSIRSDTGKINTPPVANMISPIYIPVWTRTTLVIPTIDVDNDVVRCRFANSTNECSNVCPPASLPNNTVLISSNCTLFITGANVSDWYAVTIQIEDFINSSSTTPLSSVPLQFLINVYALPNCTTPPLLYGPYNQTGACESLQVNQTYTMTLYAENYCSTYGVTIQDIATLSFPIVIKSNLTQNTSTLYSVSLTWTPTADQIGSQILCAVAIDSENVQSNQYCVAFVVTVNSTNACPGESVATTASLTTTEPTFAQSSSFDDTLTTFIEYEQSTADDTTLITTTTTITSATTSSSSNKWSWLLPVIAVLAPLLLLMWCLCLCCPPPYCLGLLCRRCCGDRSSKPLRNPGEVRQPPRMYMICRAVGKEFDDASKSGSSIASSRSTSASDKHLDPFPLTLHNSANKNEKNAVRVYPSPRSDNGSRSGSRLASSRSTIASDKHLDPIPLTFRNSANKKEKKTVWVYPSPRSDNGSRSGSRLASSKSTSASDKHLDPIPLTFRNSANKKEKKTVWVYPSPRSDKVSRSDSDLLNSRSTTASDKHLDPIPLTLRNSANKKEKNSVWVYPSSRSDNISGRDSSLTSSRITTISDIDLNLSSSTPRNSLEKEGKNIV